MSKPTLFTPCPIPKLNSTCDLMKFCITEVCCRVNQHTHRPTSSPKDLDESTLQNQFPEGPPTVLPRPTPVSVTFRTDLVRLVKVHRVRVSTVQPLTTNIYVGQGRCSWDGIRRTHQSTVPSTEWGLIPFLLDSFTTFTVTQNTRLESLLHNSRR